MNPNSTIIDEFNKTLDEFINKMMVQFPNEVKLKTYYSAFKVARTYDKGVPIKLFMGGCLKFTGQIKNRDTDFFRKRKQFVDTITEASSFSNDIGLVNYWDNLSDVSKNAIWDYIQTLYVMGEMYINKDTSIIQRINDVYNNTSFEKTLENIDNEKSTLDYLNEINVTKKLM